MSLFQQLATAGGALGFKPTALYSFEFRPRQSASRGTEMYLLVPPEQYSMNYGYRMTVHKTIGSTVVDWSGADNPTISLGGSLWSYWLDQLPSPFGNNLLGDGVAGAILNNFASGLVNKAATALGAAVSSLFPLNQMSGLDEFFRLKFMLYDFWQKEGLSLNEGMTSDKLAPTSLNTLGILPADGIFGGMRKLKKMHEENNLYEIQFIYHDYDDNVHWEVVPQNFRVSRNKNDPFTAFWNVDLVGIRDMRKTPFFVPVISKKSNADQIMKDIANTLIAINPVLIFQSAGYAIAAEFQELSKLSWDGVMNNYQIALVDYFAGKQANQDSVIQLSDAYSDTARAAQYEAIALAYRMTYGQYTTASASNTPSKAVIESGYDEIFVAISQFLMACTAMAGIRAYTGVKFPIINSTSNANVLNLTTLDEEYFTRANTGIINYSDSGWVTYRIKTGDTLASIAVRKLGDYSRFPEIARINNLRLSDFALNALVGKEIKLPIEKKTVLNRSSNLVYWRDIPQKTTANSLQEEIIGRDLYLGSSRNMLVDNSGDLKLSLPNEGFQQNISDVVSLPQGVLPLYPEWGNPIQVGSVNPEASSQIIQSKMENAIYTDPRVRTISTDVKSVKQVGTAIYFESEVTPLVGIPVTI